MKRIILSRTDSIGDVVLTLPLAGVLKQYIPEITILFLGRGYTRPVIEACSYVDEFIDWDALRGLPYREQVALFRGFRADAIVHVFMIARIAQLADAADIPIKIGTTHRLFSWLYCNRLVFFSRKHSDLHEAQLNLKLLKPLGIEVTLERERIPEYYGLEAPKSPKGDLLRFACAPKSPKGDLLRFACAPKSPKGDLLPPLQGRVGEGQPGIRNRSKAELGEANPGSRFKLILHPKSKGSAREWGLENFSRLIEILPTDRFQVFITGTAEEGDLMQAFLEQHREDVTDMTGKLTLSEFLDFIRECDGLVAASTGPLHLAAAFGKRAIGLYAPMRPIHPARWAPLGKKASYLVLDKTCNDCRKSLDCHCMKEIRAEEVKSMLMNSST